MTRKWINRLFWQAQAVWQFSYFRVTFNFPTRYTAPSNKRNVATSVQLCSRTDLLGRGYRGLGVDLVGEEELRLGLLPLLVLRLELLQHGQRRVDVGHLRLEFPPPRHQVLLHELVLLVRLVENLNVYAFGLVVRFQERTSQQVDIGH